MPKSNKSILDQHREMLLDRAKNNLRMVVLDYLTAQCAYDGDVDPAEIYENVQSYIDEFLVEPKNE